MSLHKCDHKSHLFKGDHEGGFASFVLEVDVASFGLEHDGENRTRDLASTHDSVQNAVLQE